MAEGAMPSMAAAAMPAMAAPAASMPAAASAAAQAPNINLATVSLTNNLALGNLMPTSTASPPKAVLPTPGSQFQPGAALQLGALRV